MESNILATEIYTKPTRFTTPWPFYIVDNFFSDQLYKKLLRLSNHPKFQIVDSWYNGRLHLRHETRDHYAVKKSLPLYYDLSLTEIISKEVTARLENVIDCSCLCQPDLIKCDPNYRYIVHKDHPGKVSSIVVFLNPQVCDATILLDKDRNQYSLLWRQNRAMAFTQDEHGLHYYMNTTQYPRLTLNIYMTTEILNFTVDK